MAGPMPQSRPEHAPTPCHLPAVGAFVAYRRDADRKLDDLAHFPFCRRHQDAQRAAAVQVANAVPRSEYYGAFPVEYSAGQSRIACTAARSPVELAGQLDAERITAATEDARAALRRLTALTTVAYGDSFEVGTEDVVLQALLELVDDVEEEAGTVARRLASRAAGGWFRVAEATHGIRTDDGPVVREQTAVKAWRRWGGGPGDEQPPVETRAASERSGGRS